MYRVPRGGVGTSSPRRGGGGVVDGGGRLRRPRPVHPCYPPTRVNPTILQHNPPSPLHTREARNVYSRDDPCGQYISLKGFEALSGCDTHAQFSLVIGYY
jgi:hypothetical protein